MPPPNDFIPRWQQSEAAERANFQSFLAELCDYLALPRPDPTQSANDRNTYVFEKLVDFKNLDGTLAHGRIDLYKKSHFVLEAKQGSNAPAFSTAAELRSAKPRRGSAIRGTHGWDEAMLAAKGQAEQYAKALPASAPSDEKL